MYGHYVRDTLSFGVRLLKLRTGLHGDRILSGFRMHFVNDWQLPPGNLWVFVMLVVVTKVVASNE